MRALSSRWSGSCRPDWPFCGSGESGLLSGGPLPGRGGALLAFTHTGAKRYMAQAAQRARSRGAEVIQVSGVGVDGADLATVERERSSAYTASHLGALLRAAQLARVLGADLPGLSEVPAAVEYARRATWADNQPARPPSRLIEFIGGGINKWTAAEGALKIRCSRRSRAAGPRTVTPPGRPER
jgi:hypothetical protein